MLISTHFLFTGKAGKPQAVTFGSSRVVRRATADTARPESGHTGLATRDAHREKGYRKLDFNRKVG